MPRRTIVVGVPREHLSIAYRGKEINQVLATEGPSIVKVRKLIVRKSGGP